MRPFTLALASAKGGTGKSTLAVALAVHAVDEGLSVGLLDMDAQGSLTLWWRMRGSPANPMLVPELGAKPPKGVDLTIVDSPPSNLDIIERAIKACDVAVIPVRAGLFDLAAVTDVVNLCREAGRYFLLVLNADERERRELRVESLSALRKLGPVFDTPIENRTAYVAALHRGKSGPEAVEGLAKKTKTLTKDAEEAGEEIAALWRAILVVLKHARKS